MLTLAQVGGVFLVFVLCPVVGALPLTAWVVEAIAQKNLKHLGTGNIGISAAFYHGGTIAGVLSVLAEVAKSVAAVLLARSFFPAGSTWEIIALIALVMGRYWAGRGGGATNAFWGLMIHDWVAMAIAVFITGISFTIFRQRRQGQAVALGFLPVILFALHPQDSSRAMAAALLCGLLYWIFQTMPDDLDLKADEGSTSGQSLFRFFRGDYALIPLTKPLDPNTVGGKAATLAQLTSWGYPIPPGWVLPPGDDPAPLIDAVPLSEAVPYVVRSSAMGEDSAQASAAGQYLSLLDVTNKALLGEAIARCFASYNAGAARHYRGDRDLPEAAMAVIVQRQIQGVYSGVAFSRDPVTQEPGVVLIEAVAGPTSQVVSGQVTPEQCRALIAEPMDWDLAAPEGWVLPQDVRIEIRCDRPHNPNQQPPNQQPPSQQSPGKVPQWLFEQVAYLARQLETRFHGIPQDIEWTYDGEKLWLLQSRPITTMLPIWTRKIAAEVIPGAIRPLTWSINQPLTCGVWGEIFAVVLGDRAADLDFAQTATLHHSHAYFNATLLGETFLRMGLPPESLEFLTRGAKFSKPPLASTLKNGPGLLRLLGRELKLEREFGRDRRQHFDPLLQALQAPPAEQLTPLELWSRIELILSQLKRATYYSILAPLSAAIRQAIFQVADEDLDYGAAPEIACLQALRAIAPDPSEEAISAFLDRYGYLSQVGTDIAVPTWKEDPRPVRALLQQYAQTPNRATPSPPAPSDRGRKTGHKTSHKTSHKKNNQVQRRVNLKGQVTEVYSRLLAELRWCFVALEQQWLALDWLEAVGDIFFLERSQIEAQLLALSSAPSPEQTPVPSWPDLLQSRKSQFQADQAEPVTPLVYGQEPPRGRPEAIGLALGDRQLQGIGASPGEVVGTLRVLRSVVGDEILEPNTIIVVPYTDSGWAPLLAQAAGVIAEVGGRLSHGAIVAREYGIPAVMDVAQATHILRDGQRVHLDGSQGRVTPLSSA